MLLTNPFLYRKTLRLEATPRSVSVVPNSARLLHRRRIAAQTTGVTLGAPAAGLSRTRVLLAQPVAISLAGTASLKRQLLLRCLPAEINLTTSETILQRTRLAGFIKAEITIEPQPARLLRNLVLKCQPASIDLTPNSANFLKVLGSIEAQPQAIAIEGRAADLRANRLLTAAAATVGVTPRPAQLLRTYPLSAQPVGVAVTPRPAILRLSRVLKAVKQDIAIAPKPADLIYTPIPDPSFANVSCLLHFDGANGSTTFTDSGPLGLTVTALGNAQISTAQAKFGSSSLLLDGAADRISIAGGAHFNFGTGAWTIEFYIKTSQTDQTWGVMLNKALDTANQMSWGYNFAGSGSMRFVERLTVKTEPTGTGLNDGNWNHIAITRSSNTVRMFVNGTQVSSYTTSYTFGESTNALIVGGYSSGSGGEDINGYVDELRVTKGVARYTANFTPPNAPFPNYG